MRASVIALAAGVMWELATGAKLLGAVVFCILILAAWRTPRGAETFGGRLIFSMLVGLLVAGGYWLVFLWPR